MTPTHRTLTEKLIDPIMATSPATPRVTFYDDASDERVELSTVTLMNWAAKTANMLGDQFGAEAGSRVRIVLPAHWQTAAVLLGAWWLGCEVLVGTSVEAPGGVSGEAADAAFVAEGRVDELDAAGGADEIAVLSLDAFGRPARDVPAGAEDYASVVRMHGDQFTPSRIEDTAAALDGRSIADVAEAARAVAAGRGITDADRVLSTAGWDGADELIAGLLAPLAAGASLVQVDNPDDTAIGRRIAIEKITRDLR